MWSVNEASERPWSEQPVKPEAVLYQYDHPLTFVAHIGFQLSLFHNIGQREQSLFYIVAATSPSVVQAVEDGRLSIYGALNQETLRIVETDLTLNVRRYWTTSFDNFPSKLLPERGVSLFVGSSSCPDTIEQANGFFSMRFIGNELKKTGAPFSLVKQVIDDGYEAARRLLSPSFLMGARPTTFDFDVSLVSASLMLNLNIPVISPEKLKRRSSLSLEGARLAFSQKRDEALEVLHELNYSVGRNNARELLTRNESLIGDIESIIPTEEGRVSEVEFSGQSGSKTRLISIGRRAGSAIISAYRSRNQDNVSDTGIIRIVNSASKYFVYDSVRGKQVACRIPYEIFDTIEQSELFRSGVGVRTRGRLEIRKIRDEIVCEEMPDLIDPADGEGL